MKVLFVSSPRSISIPPFSVALPVALEFRTIILSARVTVSVLTTVEVPDTIRLPPTFRFPPKDDESVTLSLLLTVTSWNDTLSPVPNA